MAVPVAVRITHFYDVLAGGTPADVDNIIKPIQDALVGVVYVDDAQVSHTQCLRSDLNGRFAIRGVWDDLVAAIAHGNEFIRVQILDPPDHGAL